MRTFLDLFCGAGGASLGLRRAGLQHVLGVEWDEKAAATYNRNLGGCVRMDVRDVKDLPEVDVWWASPPCFPAGTLVETPSGRVPIEALHEGDEVFTHQGRLRKVQKVIVTPGEHALVRVGAKAHRECITTPNHPLFVRAARGSEPEWLPAGAVRPGMLVLSPHKHEAPAIPALTYLRRVSVGGHGTPREESRETACAVDRASPHFAWLAGAYLADGHLRGAQGDYQGPSRREALFSVRQAKVEEILSRVEALGLHGGASPHTESCWRVRVSSLDLWCALGEFGRGAENKQLPAWCWGCSDQWLSAFYAGYMHGDGSTRPNTGGGLACHAITTSENWAYDLQALVQRVLGVVATKVPFQKAGTHVIQGRAVNIHDSWDVRWCPPTSRKRPAFVDTYGAWVPILDVTPAGSVETVYNLEVEEDHSYVASGLAVHNCQAWSSAGKRQGAEDERNGWPWLLDLLRRVDRPTWLLCENVRGLVDKKNLPYFETQVVAPLREMFAHVEWRMLDAADFGVPQRRHRVILAAGPAPFPWPAPTHSQVELVRAKWVTGTYWAEHGFDGPVSEASRDETRMLKKGLPGPGGTSRWRTVRDAMPYLSAWGATTNFSGSGRNIDQTPDRPGVQPVAGGKAMGGLYGVLSDVCFGSQREHALKHPHVTVDGPATTVRGGGDGHDAPHYWLEGRGLLPQWHREMDPDKPSDTVQAVGQGGPRPPMLAIGSDQTSERATGREPCVQPVDMPGPAMRAGSRGAPYLAVVGGGVNPHYPGERRTERNILDEPSTCIPAQDAGSNALPVVSIRHEGGEAQARSVDDAAPTVGGKGTLFGHPDKPGAWVTGEKAASGSSQRRRLTVAECAALQDFPPTYEFIGTKTDAYRQVGNSVPSSLSEALGRALLQALP